MRLEGKVAIVTGAADGIGRETARLFATEGAKVLFTDINDTMGSEVADEIVSAGGVATYQRLDVREAGDATTAVRAAESMFGRLDILVANAGTVGGSAFAKRFEDLTDQEWTQVIDVNLNGVFRCFRAAIPALRRAGGGALSATASIAALTGVAGQSAYTASKGGIVSVVRTLAYELAGDGIRVNCVCPGAVRTALVQRGATPSTPPSTPPATPTEFGHGTSRTADPAEIAAAHLFLVSSDSSFVNGHALVADAGSMIANRWLLDT